MRSIVKFGIGVVVVVALGTLYVPAAMEILDATSISLINNSGKLLTSVDIKIADESIWRGRIRPNDSVLTIEKLKTSGLETISYDIDGRHVVNQCDYMEGGSAPASTIYVVGAFGWIPTCHDPSARCAANPEHCDQ